MPLTKEHIIPLGLGGSVILPKASCGKCSKITGAFEDIVLHKNFRDYRAHQRLRSRRPKSRPTALPVLYKENGRLVAREVPIERRPLIFTMPIYDPPGHLIGRPFGAVKTLRMAHFADSADAKLKLNALGENAFIHNEFAHTPFLRMLAKIAHGIAVAELGLDGFEPYLPPLILGERDDLQLHLVGGGDGRLPYKMGAPIHQVSYGIYEVSGAVERSDLCIVDIRLFSAHGTPVYSVLTGRVTMPLHEREARGLPAPSRIAVRSFPGQCETTPFGDA